MKTSVRKRIVNIVESDGDLLLNWKKFYDELDLEIADYVRLNDQFKRGTLTHYELFSEILNIWVSANSDLDLDTQILKLIQVLRNIGSNLVAGKLDKEFVITTKTDEKVPIWFEVGKAPRNFVGRTDELEHLKELFNNPEELVVTITGMGGVGKSELAKNFAKQTAAADSEDCIWLNGKSKESLKNSVTNFTSLVKPVKLDSKLEPNVEFSQAISTIKGPTRILVIIDNVDESNKDVQLLISKIADGRCFFVVTSRNVAVLEYAGTIVELTTLSDEGAIDVLKKSDINEPDAEIKKLCILLGNFPLALHQAAAYIKMQKHSADKSFKILDYLKIYESQKTALLGHELNLIEHEYRETTLITWNISFEKIQKDDQFGDLAIQLLNIIAYFDPDGINVDFLNLYQPDFVEAIPLIKSYSLMKFENGVISIHRLIQQVIRLNLNFYQSDISQLAKMITGIRPLLEPAERLVGLDGYLFSEPFEEDRIDKIPFLKHIKNGMGHIVSVLKHAARYSQLLNNFNNVCLETVNNLRYFQLFREMMDLCHVNMYQLNKTLGPNADLTLQIESLLTYTEIDLDVFDERELIELKNVYDKQLSIFGAEHDSTLTTAHYIAKLHFDRYFFTELDEHIQWCRNVVELKTKVLGPLHKSTLSTKLLSTGYIGLNHKNIHKLVKLYGECYQLQITHLGAHRSGPFILFKSYVECLLSADMYEEARGVVEHYLHQNVPGYKHMVYKVLSLVLFCLGKTEEAFSMLVLSISIGDFHSVEISKFHSDLSKYKIANSFLRDENYSEALKIYKRLKICEYILDWWWTDVKYKISQCLVRLQKFKEGQAILQDVLKYQLMFGGDNSKPIIETKKLLDDINIKLTTGQLESIPNDNLQDISQIIFL